MPVLCVEVDFPHLRLGKVVACCRQRSSVVACLFFSVESPLRLRAFRVLRARERKYQAEDDLEVGK